jgi:hypothetical protein
MRKMTKKNKVLAAAGTLALVAGGGSAANAYGTTGTGSGQAAAASPRCTARRRHGHSREPSRGRNLSRTLPVLTPQPNAGLP